MGEKGSVREFMNLTYRLYHSGLDPESSVSKLDSRFRGNDGFGNKYREVLEALHYRVSSSREKIGISRGRKRKQ
jgi:uncharacterized protein YjlB